MIRHLFVPGLLGPLPGLEHTACPRVPLLETLLARADRYSEPLGYEAALLALFGIDPSVESDLPTAALGWLADDGNAPRGYLLHADPLQLHPDRDCVLAFDLDGDPLDGDEIAELTGAFNAHFGADGVHLQGSRADRVYLRCDRPPVLRTRALSSVIGRNLDLFLPDGDDSRWWRGLLNETQMLCHGLALNQRREALGRPTVGGLWFSGGGELPPAGAGPVTRLIGDCNLARGLLALRPGGSDELVIEHAPGTAMLRADIGAWVAAVEALEARLPELQRSCEALHVHAGSGTAYRWDARAARRLWRRRRPLSRYLDVDSR